jgi:hypothetical protein
MKFDVIHVECYSGYKANERPLAFTWQGKRRKVKEITDRWYEGGRSTKDPSLDRGRTRNPRLVGGELHYFKVTTDEGEEFIIRYNTLFDGWAIVVPDSRKP